MGAWIEIPHYHRAGSHERVAPLVGAWIEITFTGSVFCMVVVAPLVGAWIEIEMDDKTEGIACKSLLLWERGLKSKKLLLGAKDCLSRSSCGSVD